MTCDGCAESGNRWALGVPHTDENLLWGATRRSGEVTTPRAWRHYNEQANMVGNSGLKLQGSDSNRLCKRNGGRLIVPGIDVRSEQQVLFVQHKLPAGKLSGRAADGCLAFCGHCDRGCLEVDAPVCVRGVRWLWREMRGSTRDRLPDAVGRSEEGGAGLWSGLWVGSQRDGGVTGRGMESRSIEIGSLRELRSCPQTAERAILQHSTHRSTAVSLSSSLLPLSLP